MEPMNLYRHPKHGTYYFRYSRCECPPNGRLVALNTSDEEEAKGILGVLTERWHQEQLIIFDGKSRLWAMAGYCVFALDGLPENLSQPKLRTSAAGKSLFDSPAPAAMKSGYASYGKKPSKTCRLLSLRDGSGAIFVFV